jgi:hypothetical protein
MSEVLRMRFQPDLPNPLPRPSFVVLHSGPIEVGDTVRVIELGEVEPVEHLGLVTAVDGADSSHAE